MNDDSVSKALVELGISKVTPAAYEDLLQPASRELGDGLLVVAKTVSMALAPLEAVVWGYEQIREWLTRKVAEKLQGTNHDAILSPPLNIAGPVVLNLRFTMDIPLLREMYAKLLATSMDKDTASAAHPAFVQVIEQLSSDEARILTVLARMTHGTPVCHEVTDDRGFRRKTPTTIYEQWKQICTSAAIEIPDNHSAYMDNLLRLRIIADIHESKAKLIPEGGNEHGTWEAHIDGSIERTLYVTDFGDSFIYACVTS